MPQLQTILKDDFCTTFHSGTPLIEVGQIYNITQALQARLSNTMAQCITQSTHLGI